MTEPVFIQIEVVAVEDLHTGAGTGSGDIDALVLRDRRGEPVIRASHFKGLLRERGDELIVLNKIKEDELDALLGHDVFGRRPNGAKTPRRGALRMTSLRVLNGSSARVLVWGSSKRETNSRRPEDDTLRYVEHVAAGTAFTAEIRLADVALVPLLERLLRRIDRIGGNRNRGAGLVSVGWQPPRKTPKSAGALANAGSLSEDPAIARLIRAGVISRETDPDHAATIATRHKQQADLLQKTLRLVLRDLEPLCLPATGHPGNLIRSHSFIRGQALRGALMAWAIGRRKSADLNNVSIGDALPLPRGVKRASMLMPIPLSILTTKPESDGTELPWWAGNPEVKMADRLGARRDEKEEKPKRPGTHEYLCRTDAKGAWLRYAPRMDVRLRNQMPARGTEAEANLFSLEEIAEDTLFQVDLMFPPGAAEKFIDVFEPLLAGEDWLAIGRGGQPVQVEAAHWSMVEPETEFRDTWSLTLLSDLVLRDTNLGFRDSLDLKALCAIANEGRKGDEPPIAQEENWEIADAKFVETEVIQGFNAVTGLHRNPVIAIRRGSCWLIAGTGSAALAKALRRKQFLGERTNEGCGRFAIGVQPIEPLKKSQRPAASSNSNRQEVLLSRAKNLADQCDSKIGPSLSQLQWLREGALAVSTEDQLKKLLEGIQSAPDKRPQGGGAWQHFPTKPLMDALEHPVVDREKLTLPEKRHLVSHLVQWLAPRAKNRRKQE